MFVVDLNVPLQAGLHAFGQYEKVLHARIDDSLMFKAIFPATCARDASC